MTNATVSFMAPGKVNDSSSSVTCFACLFGVDKRNIVQSRHKPSQIIHSPGWPTSSSAGPLRVQRAQRSKLDESYTRFESGPTPCPPAEVGLPTRVSQAGRSIAQS